MLEVGLYNKGPYSAATTVYPECQTREGVAHIESVLYNNWPKNTIQQLIPVFFKMFQISCFLDLLIIETINTKLV